MYGLDKPIIHSHCPNKHCISLILHGNQQAVPVKVWIYSVPGFSHGYLNLLLNIAFRLHVTILKHPGQAPKVFYNSAHLRLKITLSSELIIFYKWHRLATSSHSTLMHAQ